MIHKIAAPAYQGRSSWPTFNVEFADRMLDYDEFSCSDAYRSCAQGILKDIRTATEVHGGYQELISERGLKYRTWAYKGRRGPLLVSAFPLRLEEGAWNAAPPVE